MKDYKVVKWVQEGFFVHRKDDTINAVKEYLDIVALIIFSINWTNLRAMFHGLVINSTVLSVFPILLLLGMD